MRKMWAIVSIAILMLFTGCGSSANTSESSATTIAESPAQIVKKSSGSFTKTARDLYKEWAGSDSTLDSGKALVTLSDPGDIVSIRYDLNVNEYLMIAVHQGFLIGKDWLGGSQNNPVNPYCDDFQNDLISYSLLRYHELSLPLPSKGIYVTLQRYSESETTDEYGNTVLDREELSDVNFGISTSDFEKINWQGKSIDLKKLSKLIPYSAPDVSWCNSRIVAGGLKGL